MGLFGEVTDKGYNPLLRSFSATAVKTVTCLRVKESSTPRVEASSFEKVRGGPSFLGSKKAKDSFIMVRESGDCSHSHPIEFCNCSNENKNISGLAAV